MNDVYGSIATPDRLVARERDPVTGRLTRTRDEKRSDPAARPPRLPMPAPTGPSDRGPARDGESGAASPVARGGRPLLVGGLAALLLVGAGIGYAVTRRDPGPSTGAAVVTAGAPGTSGSTSSGAPVVVSPLPPQPPWPNDPAPSAILFTYAGGRLTESVCLDPTGGGGCSNLADQRFDPVPVLCTTAGCTVYLFGDKVAAIGPGRPAVAQGDLGRVARTGCRLTVWSQRLTAVGSVVTSGIAHPARIVGTAVAEVPGEYVGAMACIGARKTFSYDLVPQNPSP